MRIVRTPYPRHQRRIERFLARARESGVVLEYCEEPDQRPDLELAFGGDGAVHYALERTLAADIPLLVVPFGSGNDFAESIGIHSEQEALKALVEFSASFPPGLKPSSDAAEAARLEAAPLRNPQHPDTSVVPAGLASPLGRNPGTDVPGYSHAVLADGRQLQPGTGKCSGNVRSIDVGAVTPLSGDDRKPHYYCCVAGVGMDAQANITANAMPAWLRGHGGYVVAALKAIATFPPMKITIEGAEAFLRRPEPRGFKTPERCKREDAWFAVFANAPRYGDGIFIAPKAKLDDGLLDVVLVGHMSRPRLLRFFPKVFGGSHLEIPEVRHGTASSVVLTTEPSLPIQGDGEYLCHTPAKIEIRRGALKVIVPTESQP